MDAIKRMLITALEEVCREYKNNHGIGTDMEVLKNQNQINIKVKTFVNGVLYKEHISFSFGADIYPVIGATKLRHFLDNYVEKVKLIHEDGEESELELLPIMEAEFTVHRGGHKILVEALQDIAGNCGPPSVIAKDALRRAGICLSSADEG